MINFTNKDLNSLAHLYRINLLNCISGYKSANLIGSKNQSGIENLAVFSSVVHIGSAPPLLGLIFRPKTKTSGTYYNIKATNCFTINSIYGNIIEDAHHTSAKYPKDKSEFDYTNLNPEYKKDFTAPFVKGCPIQIGLTYNDEYHIKANNTIMLIGKVQEVFISESLTTEKGSLNLTKGNIAAISGLYGYALVNNIKQYPYQKITK